MQTLTILLIGFSIFCTLLLAAAKFWVSESRTTISGNLAGFILLSSLALLQGCHLNLLLGSATLVYSKAYLVLLYCVAPSFYFYSRQVLLVDCQYQKIDFYHFTALSLAFILPYPAAFTMAFVIGGGYVLWLAKLVYSLRQQRRRFRLELAALAVFFAIAIAVLALALVKPLISAVFFFSAYAQLIGMALFVAALTLLRFPAINDQVSAAVQANYLQSTLKHIDRAAVIAQLKTLMFKDKLYRQDGLKLSILAERVQLNSHQLSELLNSELGKNFASFIREYRIDAAKKLLLEEPQSSILSIALSVGFSSQSNFYVAFAEQLGMTPGEYRKNGNSC